MSFRILGFSSLIATILVLSACGNAEVQEKLTACEGQVAAKGNEVTTKDAEILALQQRVSTLAEENTRLKQTAQFFYDEGMAAMKKKDWAGASAGFTAVTDRFPVDPLVGEARRMLSQINDERLGTYLSTLDAALSLTDKGTYTAAVETLERMIAACNGCTNAGVGRTRIGALKATLATWPEEIESIQVMRLRYSDLRGKPLRLATVVAAADTYYNCDFKSDTTWRSIEIADASDDNLNVYCRKGADFCETLFNIVVSSPQQIRDVSVKYPNSNGVCKDKQAELLGWSR